MQWTRPRGAATVSYQNTMGMPQNSMGMQEFLLSKLQVSICLMLETK